MISHSGTRALLTAAAVIALSVGTSSCMATAHPRANTIYVSSAPPRAIREVRPASPGRAYVWVPGFYKYERRAYVWVPGRYARPTYDNLRRWEQGKWHHDRNGWYWVEGQWRA